MIYLPLAESGGKEGVDEAPVAEAKSEPARQTEPEPGPAAGQPPATILLVEDDPMIRTLVAKTLEQQGYTVLSADDGWQAVQVARKHDGRIDLLLTDVVMPELGGAELALAVGELYPEIKVLFMSGYSRSQVADEGVPPGAALLEKPFTPDGVSAKVRAVLAGEVIA
jgi:DNA-binding response OmpR family regulator